MVSFTNVIILLACVVIFASRLYKKGVWQGVLEILGLMCAYGMCFLLASQLGGLVKSGGVSGAVAMILAMVVIFFVTTRLVSFLSTLLFPSIKDVKRPHQYFGVAFGATVGGIVGIVMIWVTSLVTTVLDIGNDVVSIDQDGLLGRVSSRMVAGVVRSGMQLVEGDEFKVNATAALLSSPQSFTASIAQLAKSPELAAFWQDGEAQFHMSEGAVDKIVSHEKFRVLMKMPSVQLILEQSRPESISSDAAEAYLAAQMSFAFRRMRSLRDDRRVVSILEDPEVKALIQKQNPVTLLTNKKIQSLVEIVMEEEGDTAWKMNVSGSQAMGVGESSGEDGQTDSAHISPRIIYRWKDDDGKTRYTDPDHTPDSKIRTAEKITY